jgi:O-antigen/teichoic acid export membrane protein
MPGPSDRNAQDEAADARAVRRQLVRGSGLLFGASTLASALNVVYTFAAARMLSAAEYGELVALLALVGLIGAPAGTVQVVVARFASVASDAGRLPVFAATVRRLLWLFTACTVLLAVVGLASASQIARFLQMHDLLPVQWSLSFFCGLLLLPALRGVTQGLCRFGMLAALSTVDVGFKVGLGLLLIAAGFGSAGAVAAMAAGMLVGVVLAAAVVRDVLGLLAPSGQPDDAGAMARFGLPAAGVSAGLMALVLLDSVLARHFLSPDDAGAYAAVTVAGRSLFWLSGSVAMVVLPLAARRHGRAPSTLLWPALAVTGVVMAAGLLVFHIAPGPLVGLVFGSRYLGAASLLPLYGWAALLLGLGNVTVNYLLGRGRRDAALPVLASLATFIVLAQLFHSSASSLVADLIAATSVLLLSLLPALRASGKAE